MKIAILSDVHGNAPALRTVLADIRAQGIDECIVAGDYCLSGPYPDECISILRKLEHAHIIRGNEERYLENLIGKDQRNWTDGQMQISYWNYRNISEDNLKYMLAWPARLDLEFNGVDVHVTHSRMEIAEGECNDGIGPATLAERFGDKPLTQEELADYVDQCIENTSGFDDKYAQLSDGVYVFGHSHLQWTYKVKNKNVVLVNPGSCGLPLDGVTDSIPYAILTIDDDGTVDVELRRLPFDKEAYIADLMKTTQYTEANVWSKVIIRELRNAKEHLTFFLQFVNSYAEQIGDTRRPFSVDTWEKAFELWEKQE